MPKFRFRIWQLFLLVFVICCLLALRKGQLQKDAVAFIRDQGGCVIYENRKWYAADQWAETGITEHYKPDLNQPYSAWQQLLLDPNHYNEILAVRFGHVLVESEETAKKYGAPPEAVALMRDSFDGGGMVMPYHGVSDSVFAELLNKLRRLPRVQYLGLEYQQITDKHLQDLAQFQQLKEIRLRGCTSLTQEAVDGLRSKLPDCEISFEDETVDPR